MSKFLTGQGGRKKGSPNKVTGLQRQFIQTLLEGQQDKIISELNTLQGKDYLTAIHGFMEFAIPKLQRTEIEGESIKNIRVITGMVIM